MLGLGVIRAWAALGAISAAHHGWPENVANYGAEYRTARVREVDVGIVQTLSNQNSRVTIGFKLVLAHLELYLQFQRNLFNEFTYMTPQTNITCRKLRVSAFQWS